MRRRVVWLEETARTTRRLLRRNKSVSAIVEIVFFVILNRQCAYGVESTTRSD